MSIPTTPDRLREQIRGHLRLALSADVDDSEDIFLAGLVNSLFAVQLVMFVEQDLGVAVDNDDMEIRNFCSVDAISEFVSGKLGVSGSG